MTEPEEVLTKRPVYVHVTFVKFGTIDAIRGTFEAEITIRIRWKEPGIEDLDLYTTETLRNFWNPDIYVDNIVGSPDRTITLSVAHFDQEIFVVETMRISATFIQDMDGHHFPFDIQDLSVVISSNTSVKTTELIDDVANQHIIYKSSFINDQQFHFYEFVSSETQRLPDEGRTMSRHRKPVLIVYCRVARRPGFYIIHIFVTLFAIGGLAFLSLVMNHDDGFMSHRLQVCFMSVVASVTLKQIIITQTPEVPYFTISDWYFIGVLTLQLSVCFYQAFLSRMRNGPDDTHRLTDGGTAWEKMISVFQRSSWYRQDVDPKAGWLFLILYSSFSILYVIWIIVVPYGRRREMNRIERIYKSGIKKDIRKVRMTRLLNEDVERDA